jgi:hypothetical protein
LEKSEATASRVEQTGRAHGVLPLFDEEVEEGAVAG